MSSAPRPWGFWTQFKLGLLRDYLNAFTTASKRMAEIVYLDAFAGQGRGVDRVTGVEFPGSARIALNVKSPPFTRVRLFELPSRAEELDAALREEYPGRDIVVYPGDCNLSIPRALQELSALRWAPTFAFLDPDGMKLQWSMLTALAAHKQGSRYKTEIWMLFPTSGLVRTLALDEAVLHHRDEERATKLFGDERWRAIYERRRTEAIDPATARDEYVNLLRWRMEKHLGYSWTHPLLIRNERGHPLYHMVFATDNAAGDRIMSDLYGKAAGRFEAMRAEARERRSGQARLPLGDWAPPAAASYDYEPPVDPDSLS